MTLTPINIYQLLLYLAAGGLLLAILFALNTFVLPLQRNRKRLRARWEKYQIIAVGIYLVLLYVALFRFNFFITLIFTGLVVGLGWNFWKNIFAGLVIRFSNQLRVGEFIRLPEASGQLMGIYWSRSDLLNERGETVSIPNHALRSAVLVHIQKNKNVKQTAFTIESAEVRSLDEARRWAHHCPYLSSNQPIDIEETAPRRFAVQGVLVDRKFRGQAEQYFAGQMPAV